VYTSRAFYRFDCLCHVLKFILTVHVHSPVFFKTIQQNDKTVGFICSPALTVPTGIPHFFISNEST
jgi:hypothetical protein